MSEMSALVEDVRVLCHNLDTLAPRMQITRLMLARDLPAKYAEQRELYPNDLAVVPNPSLLRQCLAQEVGHYAAVIGEQPRKKTDVVMYIGQDAELAGALFTPEPPPTWFGLTTSGAGRLTTTPHDVAVSNLHREGMHVDSGETYAHRLGVCVAGQRQLVVATQSARQFLGQGAELSTTAVRQRFAQDPALLGEIPCLLVSFGANEAYDAWTGELLHDGSTWLQDTKRGKIAPASQIIFTPL